MTLRQWIFGSNSSCKVMPTSNVILYCQQTFVPREIREEILAAKFKYNHTAIEYGEISRKVRVYHTHITWGSCEYLIIRKNVDKVVFYFLRDNGEDLYIQNL
jgi:hypothetical protein